MCVCVCVCVCVCICDGGDIAAVIFCQVCFTCSEVAHARLMQISPVNTSSKWMPTLTYRNEGGSAVSYNMKGGT